jgi:hypothetical protein
MNRVGDDHRRGQPVETIAQPHLRDMLEGVHLRHCGCNEHCVRTGWVDLLHDLRGAKGAANHASVRQSKKSRYEHNHQRSRALGELARDRSGGIAWGFRWRRPVRWRRNSRRGTSKSYSAVIATLSAKER